MPLFSWHVANTFVLVGVHNFYCLVCEDYKMIDTETDGWGYDLKLADKQLIN